MRQFDKNTVSRLPQWRSYEHDDAQPPKQSARGPTLRPSDFAQSRRVPGETAASIEPDAASTPDRAVPLQQQAPEELVSPEEHSTQAAAPILDPGSAISAIWDRRLIVLGLSLLGALAGGVVLPMTPQKFTAKASLYFDPSQIGVADLLPSSSGSSPETVFALVDSQARILTSGNVLRRVANSMNLYQDPEFTAGRSDGAAVIGALQKAIVITREASTYIVSLAATTRDPQKSARLANQVVSSFLQEESNTSTGRYENTANALDGRLTDLRQKLQQSEQAVETYRADNAMTSTPQGLISDQRLTSLNTLLVTAQDKTIQAKARADAASKLSFEQVVDGGQQDQTATSTALTSLRQQYATQAALIGNLESQLGARHPRLQAARSSLQSIANEVRSELERLAKSAQSQYDQAKKAEEAVSKQLSLQEALQVDTSDKQVVLNELQRKAAAAREIYEALLKRSDQTTEERNLARNNMRIISEAELPVKADGPGRKMLLVAGVIGGFLAGFAAGAGFAVLASLLAHPIVRGYIRRRT